jgi:DNA-binding NarL/FixJ family response regulator
MKILIADDHSVVREGLRQVLADEFPGAFFGYAENTQQTLDSLRKEEWDIVLLDVFMPGRSGLEVLREARLFHPKLPVLVVTSAPEEQLAVRVLQAGAAGFLNKQAASDELVVGVKKLLAGGRYVSPRLAETLARDLARPTQLPHEELSDREFQVFQLLISGKNLKTIASELSLSPKTISTFHSRILDKLKLQNDVQLVHYALEHQLLDPTTLL